MDVVMVTDTEYVYLDWIELEWDRKYFECGNFMIQIPLDQYRGYARYIYRSDRQEIGVIEKTTYKNDKNQTYVVFEGRFLESALNRSIVYPALYGSGKLADSVTLLVQRFELDLPNSRKTSINSNGLAQENYTFQVTGDAVGDTLYSILKEQGLSQNMRIHNFDNPNYEYVYDYKLWQGRDLSSENEDLAEGIVQFSESLGNIISCEYVYDISNFVDRMLVAGSGEGANRLVAYAGVQSPYCTKFYDAKNEQYDSTQQTQTEYKANLTAIGKKELLNYPEITNVEIETDDSVFEYMKDYDLGDKCDLILDSIQKSFVSRIIEVDEHYSRNEESHKLIFGDKIPTIYDKVKM